MSGTNMTRPNLMRLVIDNKAAPRSFTVTATEGGQRIDLYDVIDDYYGVSASAFVSALNAIKDGDIELHINSPGGDVFAARAMVAAIAAHPSNITAYIDGLAASAASYVALACNSVVMQAGSMMMIHCASTIVWGTSSDMTNIAALLDKIDATIVEDYARKTGKSAEVLIEMMREETWMTASEAKKEGFADSVVQNEKGRAKNTWNLSAYSKVPQSLVALEPAPEPAPDPAIETFAQAEPEPAPAPVEQAAPVLTLSSADAQLLETTKFKTEEIIRPSMTQANRNRLALIQAL